MGNLCSGKATENQTIVHSQLRHHTQEGQISADQLRDMIKLIKHQAFKFESIADTVRDIQNMLSESTQGSEIIDELKTSIDKVDKEVQNNQQELAKYIDELSTIIDQCTQTGEHISTQEQYTHVKEIDSTVNQKQTIIEDIEKRLRDIRKRWNQLLVENEDTETLQNELQKLFDRIDQESSNYKSYLEQIQEIQSGITRVLQVILEDKIVQLDYDHKKESLLKMQDKVKENEEEYFKLNERYQKALEKVEELKGLFHSCIKGQQKFTSQQMQNIDNEAQKFLEINRTLGADVINLHKLVTERRDRLQDVDIIENASQRRAGYETLSNEIGAVEDALNYLMQSMQFKHISSIDDDQQQNIEKMMSQVETFIDRVNIKLSEPANMIYDQLVVMEADVNSQYDQLKTKDLKSLIPLIQKIAQLGQMISNLRNEVANEVQDVEIMKMNLGEMDLGSKLYQHQHLTLQHRDQLKASEEEIRMMKLLLDDLGQNVSDDEEQDNVKIIKGSLDKLTEKSKELKDQCHKSEVVVEKIQNQFQEFTHQQFRQEEMDHILKELSQVEKQINQDDKDVEELALKIEKKAQRFKEFDLKDKLKKRQKQCDEGRQLKTKVKNRSTKMVRKVLEKSDQRLSDENVKLIATLKEQAQQYKKQYEELAKIHDSLETELNDKIAKQIPDDTLSVSIQEQVKLYKILKQFDTRLRANNEKLNTLREQLKEMQEQVYNIPDEEGSHDEPFYQAVEGDQMDQLMGDFMRKQKYHQLNIQRLSPGQYLFGTKKISAKIMNGKLFVRVGGGYTSIEEYIQQYGEQELKKQKLKEFEELGSVHSYSHGSNSSPLKGQTIRHSQTMKDRNGNGNESPFGEPATIDLNLDDNVDFLAPISSSRTSSDVFQKQKTQKTPKITGKFTGQNRKEESKNHF